MALFILLHISAWRRVFDGKAHPLELTLFAIPSLVLGQLVDPQRWFEAHEVKRSGAPIAA